MCPLQADRTGRFGGPDHAIKHLDGKGDLTLLTEQRAGAQSRTDGGLVAADPSLRQAAATVAGDLLPGHTTLVADVLDVAVTWLGGELAWAPVTADERGGMMTVGGRPGCLIATAW